ncbi:hypothetical protein FRC08_000472 [Ceratobasidium sp. 394]|nr:hypothetical protein FRC08_000472 [Ceratobasidium sp. 394]
MALFHTLRTVTFATVLGFSLIVLGISGHWQSLLQGYYSVFAGFSAFALAVSVMTWAFLLPIYLVGMLRKGSLLSWVVVELGVCGLLWVLWLASASYTSSMTGGATLNCDYALLSPEVESICRQFQALQAFSWLNWLIIFAYVVMLLVFAIRAQGQGHSVWTSDVTDLPNLKSGSGPSNNTVPQPAMQQNAYHPNGAPSQYSQPPYSQTTTPAV